MFQALGERLFMGNTYPVINRLCPCIARSIASCCSAHKIGLSGASICFGSCSIGISVTATSTLAAGAAGKAVKSSSGSCLIGTSVAVAATLSAGVVGAACELKFGK